ncbi:MAG: hypothetical protein C0448_09260 [Sphingobacteriaceae bacterium]|nr:hypothetical protein [Sphingobacteriaceae bacterium]
MNKNPHIIEATEDTPLVVLEKKDGVNSILIQGVSMPENLFDFYTPLFETVFNFFETDSITNMEINVEYMNSMSNKQILKLIKTVYEKAPSVKVIWKYSKEDDLIKLKGQEIQSVFPEINILLTEY